eukprot:XP_011678964.1 PREDICTED: forkhead box protein D1-like [Strongylocentrotus purpuratus]
MKGGGGGGDGGDDAGDGDGGIGGEGDDDNGGDHGGSGGGGGGDGGGDSGRMNPRHLEDLKFRHLFARKDGLHFSAIHEFPRLWDTLPSELRNSVLTVSFSTWCSHLKSHLADAP